MTQPRQYIPFSCTVKNQNLIVYPVKDENPLTEIFETGNKPQILEHLEQLYTKFSQLATGAYHIVFLWNLDGHRMTDIWVHTMENWSDSGPLLTCLTFRDLEPCIDAGIASGDSVIVLGREEELRRKIPTLEVYLDRSTTQPDFPEGFAPTEAFV